MPGIRKPASQQIEKNISYICNYIFEREMVSAGRPITHETHHSTSESTVNPKFYFQIFLISYFSVYTLWNNSHTYCTDAIKAIPRIPRSLLVWASSTSCCHLSTKYCSHGKVEEWQSFLSEEKKMVPNCTFLCNTCSVPHLSYHSDLKHNCLRSFSYGWV